MFAPSVVQTLNQNGIKFLHIFILWAKGLLNVRNAKKRTTAKESSGIIMVRNSKNENPVHVSGRDFTYYSFLIIQYSSFIQTDFCNE